MDASEFKEFIFWVLFLKRISDQFEEQYEKILTAQWIEEAEEPLNYTYFVPKEARWSSLKDEKKNVGNTLNKALELLEDANPEALDGVLKHIDFNVKKWKSSVADNKLVDLLVHFSKYRLRNNDFEFPDLLGAAYEYLLKYFADSAGKKWWEFYTPANVVRLLVQLTDPQEGMSIYDPTVWSWWFLIQAKQYVEEQGQDSENLSLNWQEANGTTRAISKMNMILHDVKDAKLEHGDTLTDPRHIEWWELVSFDRILANPPFSQNYTKSELTFAERFEVFTPEKKKADFMFLQHMVASLKANGKLACVMPHGVLFRSWEEKEYRKLLTQGHDILEAVIGLPDKLFYGTGIPASVLVINKNKSPEMKHKYLFINADREYAEAKNQNILRTEDIEKITDVYHHHKQINKYSRLVTLGDIQAEDYNLNIRRYVDNTPEPETQDVRAHLLGWIPVKEVQDKQTLLDHFGIQASDVFTSTQSDYYHFLPQFESKESVTTHLEDLPSLRDTYDRLTRLVTQFYQDFWNHDLSNLSSESMLAQIRHQGIEGYVAGFVDEDIFTEHQIRGMFANRWSALYYDLKSVKATWWSASLIQESFIISNHFAHLQEQIDTAQSHLDEYIAQIDEKKAEAEAEDDEYKETKEEKGQIKTYKNHVTSLTNKLTDSIQEWRSSCTPDQAKALINQQRQMELNTIITSALDRSKRTIVWLIENRWDKYHVSATQLEQSHQTIMQELDGFLSQLWYK